LWNQTPVLPTALKPTKWRPKENENLLTPFAILQVDVAVGFQGKSVKKPACRGAARRRSKPFLCKRTARGGLEITLKVCGAFPVGKGDDGFDATDEILPCAARRRHCA